jgi:hypothetical protein
MGLTKEYQQAREWVKDLSFDIDDKFHNFEVSTEQSRGRLPSDSRRSCRSRFASSAAFSPHITSQETTRCIWTRPSTWPIASFPCSILCAMVLPVPLAFFAG